MPGPTVNEPLTSPAVTVHVKPGEINPDLLLVTSQERPLSPVANPVPVTVTTVAMGPFGGDNEIDLAKTGI
jgi:hypothetical protein